MRVRIQWIEFNGLDSQLPGLIPLAARRRQLKCGLHANGFARSQGKRLL